ncbi:MAG TPA: hypothetical protein VHE82_07445 [Gemmatimonadaceae bacterium]|nr:hypothetical protein [Gemmatimonadaceae bacterium]
MPVEQKVRHNLLELLILVPELVHFVRLAHRHALVLFALAVKRGLRDAKLAAYLHCGRSSFDLPERLHDLVFSEFAWSHLSILHRCAPLSKIYPA